MEAEYTFLHDGISEQQISQAITTTYIPVVHKWPEATHVPLR